MTKICVFGAGAIGGYVGARLALKGEAEVSLVARGAHLAAMMANGLTLIGCYHTSRYNVQTGRMNNRMFLDLLDQVRLLLE